MRIEWCLIRATFDSVTTGMYELKVNNESPSASNQLAVATTKMLFL
jgi:hypothetical protein